MCVGQKAICRTGEAQRLSSLTFGCFQVRGKNPQVLAGPEPSHRTLSGQQGAQHWEQNGKNLHLLNLRLSEHTEVMWSPWKVSVSRKNPERVAAFPLLFFARDITCHLFYFYTTCSFHPLFLACSFLVDGRTQSPSASSDTRGQQHSQSPGLSLRLYYARWRCAKKWWRRRRSRARRSRRRRNRIRRSPGNRRRSKRRRGR